MKDSGRGRTSGYEIVERVKKLEERIRRLEEAVIALAAGQGICQTPDGLETFAKHA